jgi:phosphotransferase system enzyme I (PtsI)
MSSVKQQQSVVGKTYGGIGVSPGVVIGPAYVVVSESLNVVESRIEKDDIPIHISRLEDALIATRKQIKTLQKDLERRTTMRDASILDAHLMVLDDRMFVEEVIKKIHARVNVEAAVSEVSESYAEVLAAVDDDYLRERVADIRDVARRVVINLTASPDQSLSNLRRRHIVVAKDLAPSETASMRKDLVVGFATDLGSPTAHSAVMARALEIPAVVALRNLSESVSAGDELLIDGNKGVLIVNPTPEQLEEYGRVAKARESIEKGLGSLQHEPAETRDGHRITLSANTEGLEEVDAVIRYGAEGVGLFRSEYLFLVGGQNVSEDAQAAVYSEVAQRLNPAPVIIRTMDIGGDKAMPDMKFEREANPFLGCRSIRLSLLYPEPFRIQLKAILRASAVGNVKLMYPMISNLSEVLQANAILDQAKDELRAEGVAFKEDIEVGIMVEIPSAALTADLLAEHVSFFSIGTNDLIQYTLAVDRVNERVAYLYEPTHPAVLRLVQQTVDAGHKHGIWVGLCGEMAGDPLYAPLLLGLGVDELSAAPSAVPLVKDSIRSVSLTQAQELAERALACKTGAEVVGLCRALTSKVAPELLELI